jgi:predicted DNA-binding transcriptional regulator AlpA
MNPTERPARGPSHVNKDLITKDHASALMGITSRTLDTMSKTGRAPAPYKLGSRSVRYSESEILEWVASCRSEPKSGTAAPETA